MTTADFIVVGLGAAGCIVVNRLVQSGYKVIGIEAGPNETKSLPIKNPAYVGQLQGEWFPVYFWQQESLPNGRLVAASRKQGGGDDIQVGCHNFAMTDQPPRTGLNNYTTGRIAGGGSSINGEQFVTGSKGFWDTWSKLVCDKRWDSSHVKEAFGRIQSELSIRTDPGSATDRYVAATIDEVWNKQAGGEQLKILKDYNSLRLPESGGVDHWQYFQYPDGSRADAYNTFIEPIRENKNYQEYLNTTALRLLFDRDRSATGVIVLSNGKQFVLQARKEVILCCGVYSCALLQRSGVGPAKECCGIKHLVTSPHVGLHSRNQLIMRMFFNTDSPLSTKRIKDLYTGGSFLPVLSPAERPNIRGYQLFGVILSPTSFLLLIIHLQPHSEGQIKVASADPLAPLLPDNNYFGDSNDLRSWLLLWERILIPLTKSLSPWVLTSPPPSVLLGPQHTRKEWLLQNLDQTHHWTGSNRMATCVEDGVVDPSGKVFGTKNVRIADISVAPLPPDGNPCGPAYAVGDIIARSIVSQDI